VLVSNDLKNPESYHWAWVSPAEFLDYQEQCRSFDRVFGGAFEKVLLSGREAPANWWGLRTAPNTFRVLGVPAAIGRSIVDSDSRPGAPPVVVLSNKAWQQELRGDPGIIGQTLILNRQPTTVVGVMPPRFRYFGGVGGPDCWLPAVFSRGETEVVSQASPVFGHLKPGVTFEQASAEFEVLANHLAAVYPKTHPPGVTFSRCEVSEVEKSPNVSQSAIANRKSKIEPNPESLTPNHDA
jgi:putative ABC transport system permease protein